MPEQPTFERANRRANARQLYEQHPDDAQATVPLDSLTEYEDNPRNITPKRLDDLKHSLVADPTMLAARPIIVDRETNEVVCGNMRLRAARELGWQEIPVYYKRFDSEAQKREWLLRDNQEYGDWVPDQLAEIIAQHASEGFDPSLMGFDSEEVEQAVRRATGEAFVPPPSDPPNPMLTSEAYVEIRCTRAALEDIMPTLESWEQTEGIELAVTT